MLAGGTDLMVEVNEAQRRLTGDETVVAVGRVPELRTWRHDPLAATVRLGAGVTYAELESEPLAALLPALAQAARTVGSPQIRNAATIGGNLATCSPAGDGLPVLAALDADVELAGPDGARTMPVGEFMTGVKRTDLPAGRADHGGDRAPARRLAGLRQGRRAQRHGHRHRRRLPRRRPADPVDPHRPRLGGPDDRAGARGRGVRRRCRRLGRPAAVDGAAAARFGELAAAASRPIDDHRATAAYRRRAVEVLARRLLRRAFPEDVSGVGRDVWEDARDRRWRDLSEQYRLHVNGTSHDVADAWLGESLLYVLRERLGLLGAKGACEQGSAARAACSSTASWCAPASCSRPAPSTSRSSPSRASPSRARRPTSSGRSSTPAPCSAGSARPGW